MPNRWRALRSIQLKRWNHWVRNVMRHHLNYVQWTQITGILLSTSHPLYLFLPSPLLFPLVCCVHSRTISGQVQSQRLQLPGCSWLRMRKTKCKKCTMRRGRKREEEAEKRQLWKCNWDSFTQRWLCVDNDLCKVANLISCAPKMQHAFRQPTVKCWTPHCHYPIW